MKGKILKALREADGYVSGQGLCGQFGVTRSAIWKGIRQLKEEGYLIEAVPNKGYRLLTSPDSISEAELKSRLETSWAGQNICSLETVDSTNHYAKELGEQGAAHGTLVVADEQTGGKGRKGRTWVTPKGTAIAMSLLLRPDLPPEKASMLTLVAGLSVVQALEETTGQKAGIKWPNDAVLNGKKVCGILTEMSMEMEEIYYVVIGMGINANITAFPEELQEIATSLKLELGHPVERAPLICSICAAFEKNYGKFMETQDMSRLLPSYERFLVNQNRAVRVLEPGNEYEGVARGVDEKGQLLVETKTGEIKKIYAGEVSVRGIYGYV